MPTRTHSAPIKRGPVILCSGAFDGLHAGHVAYLKAAREVPGPGEPQHALWVAVAPDAYIVQVKHRQPYWSQADRVRTIEALAVVDRVVTQRELSVARVIREMRPAYFVKGIDWTDRLPRDVQSACADVKCLMVYVDTPGRHVAEARR